MKVINPGLATDCNTSGYKLLVEETLISNQVRFDETFFPRRNRKIIDDDLTNITKVDVVSLDREDMKWISYDSEKVHSGGSSDSYILWSMSEPDLYMGVKREDFFKSQLSKGTDELLFSALALVARMKDEPLTGQEGSVTGVPAGIDVNKQPNNFRDAMSREDQPEQELAEAYNSEYQGFLEHGTLKIVRLEPGAKMLGTNTHTEYKVINGVFKKRKVRLCVLGNQQKEGVHFQLGELYA